MAAKYQLRPSIQDMTIDQYLAARWTGQKGLPSTGLRSLTAWFNQAIMKTIYAEHNRKTVQTQLESDYEALTGDDEERKHIVLDDLSADGIDGTKLLDTFISSSTLYRHLTDCVGVEKQRVTASDSDTDWERQQLSYTESIVEENVSEILQSLNNKDQIAEGTDAEIAVRIYLECPVCAKQTELRRAWRRGYICEKHADLS